MEVPAPIMKASALNKPFATCGGGGGGKGADRQRQRNKKSAREEGVVLSRRCASALLDAVK
jgi:hypothetical protein